MIKIVEVGPRDGLQNETATVPVDAKVAFVNALSDTGVSEIEVSAFVSSKMVPQLRDAGTVFKNIRRKKGIIYSALVPNIKGFDRAVDADVEKISVFTAASETFNQKNINTTVDGSLDRFQPVVKRAVKQGLPVRGYISTAFWCPFEGKINPEAVVVLTQRLMDMGINEVSISDTIGKATPEEVKKLMDVLLAKVPVENIAVHFHDTYGRGIANVLQSVSYGIRVVDASAGGLGGCPFAPGATGNVATEAVAQALIRASETVNVSVKGIINARRCLDPYLQKHDPALPAPESLACSTCEFFNNKKCCGKKISS
ncbi:hydroxymethylglutaryl-CoA lyase [Desulfocicer vacuolatum DSM 3385]|uniref:Hydroxymethylglutaryl-CoA lyase n=1 Tax=Desulfocicer vacuolatum DSM 3385 TaxID=1121400 RepID=A0A1W2ELR1_9BACT|nr:hydroxymethylglutaryl-CoA lyase [Desulfocicer vacuolatum]SMD10236.1 hydroxymethylglutaryl-CoA lyase [Desulfocicer vacuolatum DSM 3385]